MGLLTHIDSPTEGIRHQQERTVAHVGDKELGVGRLYITESYVTWLSEAGEGFSLEYPSISLHAVARDQSAFPKPCLYVMFDGKLDPSSNNESEEDEGEPPECRDPEPDLTEIRFVPEDVNSLESMYTALADCQILHPDEDDSLSEDEDEYDGTEQIIFGAAGDIADNTEPSPVGLIHNNGDGDGGMELEHGAGGEADGQFEDVDD